MRWHVVVAVALAALPEALNYLGVVDLKPILAQFLPEHTTTLIAGLLPFVLAFLKPLVIVSAKDPE